MFKRIRSYRDMKLSRFKYLRCLVIIRNKSKFTKLQIQKAQQYIDKFLSKK